MRNNNTLTGVVMLETMWKTRTQDLLDLISPFVYYSIAKVCSPYEMVDLRKTLEIIKREFGYNDMPVSVVERVIARNPGVFELVEDDKHRKAYKLIGTLDDTVTDIEHRREECDKKIEILGQQISEYLSLHVSKKKQYTIDEATMELQGFFSRNGVFLGTNQLEEHAHELEGHEEDYYIAQYLYEKRDQKSKEYDYVIDLVKGYFLQSAIYLQIENDELSRTTYKDVRFYYDTPFLLRLLGYKTEEDKYSSNDLHNALQKQQGKCFYFSQTREEVTNILKAYKRDIGYATDVTLEGLDELRYTPSDVERLVLSWQQRLEDEFSTTLVSIPLKKKGILQPDIDEQHLKEYLGKRIRWKSQSAMDADIESAIGIHKLRGDIVSDEVENCKALFVTTNGKLCRAFNEYYKENIARNAFPPLITDSDLAALTWIKSGSTNDMPERQLLRNAYIACQPTPEMLEKFGQILDHMQGEGKVTQEMAIAIRTSRYTRKEILFSTFGTGEGINENVVIKIEKMLKEEFSQEAREDEHYKAEQRIKHSHNEHLKNADRKAREIAQKAMCEQLMRERNVVKWIGMGLIIFAIIGLMISILGSVKYNAFIILSILAFIAISIDSVVSTWQGRKKRIDKWLVNRSIKTHDRILKEKTEEYRSLIQ